MLAYFGGVAWLEGFLTAHPAWMWFADHLWDISLVCMCLILLAGCVLFA